MSCHGALAGRVGLPIRKGGGLLAALAVSGAPGDNDEICARRGVATIQLRSR